MKSSEVIQFLKSAIVATKEAGIRNISIDDLEKYASSLEETAKKTPEDVSAGEAAMEAYKADLNSWASTKQQQHESDLEMLRATITTGQSALKSSLLINGGASVAMLAFVGNLWSKNAGHSLIGILSESLACYVFGVLSAALASGLTYLSQAGFGGEFGSASNYIGRFGRILAVTAVIVSYVLFGMGSWLTYLAISNI